MAKVESRFPLHEAAKRCDSGTIGALLREGGADVNAKDADGLPALYHAVHHGDCPQCDGPEEAVRLLCESGADVHETFPGMDPLKPTYLLMAMCGFTVPVIQALLTAGELAKHTCVQSIHTSRRKTQKHRTNTPCRRQTRSYTNTRTQRSMHTQTDKHTDRHTQTQTDTDTHTDRQTDRHTHTHTHTHTQLNACA